MAVSPHPEIWYKVDKRRFERKLNKLIRRSKDLSPAFHTIGRMFRQSRSTIFKLKSAGGYEDLSPKTKERKINSRYTWYRKNEDSEPVRKTIKAKPYPILKSTGELEKSLTRKGYRGNVTIVKKKQFAFGTRLWYAKFHNSMKGPRRKIPLRMFVFWGPEAPRTMRNRTDATKRFADRALKVIKNFIARDNANAKF